MTHRFTIIVPTIDRRDMLQRALASIAAQACAQVETIVVDGGSTDGTVEALRGRAEIRLLVGPDAGVYDAINKGIACATGAIVGLLNSDDTYEPGAFAAVDEALGAAPDAHAACGIALVADRERVIAIHDDERDQTLASPRTALIGACVPNARFFRRSAMARVGPFSLDYRFVADRDWLTRWYEAGLTTVAIPVPVYRYGQHAGSLTFDRDRRREAAIRHDLVALARRWRLDSAASAETRRVAELLEGRCRAYLALAALRAGRLPEVRRWLVEDDARVTPAAAAMIARSAIDWLTQRLRTSSA